MKAETAPFPFLLVGGIAFAVIVVMLLLLMLLTGGKKRGAGAPAGGMPAPVVAGGPQGYGGAPQQPYGGGAPQQPFGGAAPPQQPFGGGAPQQPFGGAPVAPPGQPMGFGGAPAGPAPFAGGAPAPGAPGGDFMYGGQPPQFGLTGAQPAAVAAPPDPYAGGGMSGASRAVISGAAGTFPINPGMEVNVGRDGARCQVLLQEPRVSAVHSTLKFEGGQLQVRDGGSNNGTYLNGNRLPPSVYTPVPPGSMLRFGPVEFLVRLE